MKGWYKALEDLVWLTQLGLNMLLPLGMWLVFYKVLTVNIPLGPLNFLRTLVDMI